MDYYRFYAQKLVGGLVPTTMYGIKPGYLLTFRYPKVDNPKANRRRFYRLVLVLGIWKSPSGLKLHGVKVENIPWALFRKFMIRVLVTDTITLLKRRYELKAPIQAMINRPLSFYANRVKILLKGLDCYRTYNLKELRQIKIGYMDYSSLYSTSDKYSREVLIQSKDSLKDMKKEQEILSEILGFDIINTNDTKFKKLIKERFGTIENFILAFRKIEDYVDESEGDIIEPGDLLM